MDWEITPLEVKRKMDAGEAVHLIDVREPVEFQITRIEGADWCP
jgi:adenylyltransferase/sulfurtransferase